MNANTSSPHGGELFGDRKPGNGLTMLMLTDLLCQLTSE